MEPHQERVVAEQSDLSEKWGKLICFIETPDFSKLNGAEQSRLKRQAVIMRDYIEVLNERIGSFSKAACTVRGGIVSGLSAVDYMLKINRDCLKRHLLPVREHLRIIAMTCQHEERKGIRDLFDHVANAVDALQSMVDEITAEQEELR
ncbi:hypothetical protein UFOVP1419_23 [uncultured Caudovirales phage]|uniref:Uncharacterized protein n=1 Tax=uncultured Caudovirales phage TaxID=2100421 RepID=A0A6J5SDX0_9CAUD|nr:hypothetical protein UFOVP1419_23 [uncultured Caudovirales phage]